MWQYQKTCSFWILVFVGKSEKKKKKEAFTGKGTADKVQNERIKSILSF